MSMARWAIARRSEPEAEGAPRFPREERRRAPDTEAAEVGASPALGIDIGRSPPVPPGQPVRRAGRSAGAAFSTTRGVLQAKLAVGSVDDPLEHEADRVADKVLRMHDQAAEAGAPAEPPGLPVTPSTARLSRKCGSCKDDEDEKGVKVQRRAAPGAGEGLAEAPPIVEQALGGGGRPLDTGTRAYFEPRFGFDLSKVRIHTDARAQESARSVNAHAYTVGQNIVFGQGRYAPGEGEGRRLLAHELAHVAQQSAAARPVGRPAAVSSATPRVAREPGPGLSPGDLVVVANTEFTKNGLQMAKDINSGTPVATLKVGGLLKLGDKHPHGGGAMFFATVMKTKDDPYPDNPTGVVRAGWVRPAGESDIASAPAPVFPAAKPAAAAPPAAQNAGGAQGQAAPAQGAATIGASSYAKTTVQSSATTGGAMLLDKLGGANVLGGQAGLPMGTLVHLESSLAGGQAFMVKVVDGAYKDKVGVLSRSYLQAAPAPAAPAPSQEPAQEDASANASVDPSAASAGPAGPVGPQGPVGQVGPQAPAGVVTSGDKQALLTAIRGVQKSDVASGLYTATFGGKASNISKEQYDAFFAKIAVEIRNATADVERLATDAKSYYQGQTEVNRRYWLSSEIVALFGNVQDPGPRLLELVSVAQAHAAGARKSLESLDYEGAATELAEGETAARLSLAMWWTYFNSVQHAGELTISKLETTRNVAGGALLLLAAIATGGAALGVAGMSQAAATAGYVMTGAALAEQVGTAALKLNDGDKVDWVAFGLEATLTVVLQLLGGAASGKILNAVLSKGASVTAQAFAGALSGFLVGRGSAAVHAIVTRLWQKYNAKKQSTWGEFWAEVLTEVLDPKGAFIDLLMGALGGVAHHREVHGAGNAGEGPVREAAAAAPPEVKPPAAPEVKPAAPAAPVAEVKPAAPAAPAAEVKPAAPAAPVAEVKPAAPAAPVAEVKPAAPEVKPVAPEVKPAAPEVKPAAPEVKPAAPEVKPAAPEVKPAAPDPNAAQGAPAQEVKAPAAADDGSSSGGTRGKDVYKTDNINSKGLGIGPKKLQEVIKQDIPEIRTRDGYSAKLTVDSSTKEIPFQYEGNAETGTVVTGTLTVTDTTGVVLGTVDVTVRSTKKFTVGEAHANETGPARIDLVPPDVANGKPNWKATIEMNMHTRLEDVKFVVGHELDEAAGIVAKKTSDPAQIAAEGQPRVMKEKAADIDPKNATAHDKAHVKEIDALSADLDKAAEKIKIAADTAASGSSVQVTPEMIADQKAKGERLRRALEITGLSEPARFSDRRKMLLALGMNETRVNMLETFVNAAEFARSAPHPGMQATRPAIVESTIDHLLHPSMSDDFKTKGIAGGHSDENLQKWVEAHPEYALKQVKTNGGDLIEYEQYEWKGTGPVPTAAADRPGGANAKIGQNGWKISDKPKTTTKNLQKFLVEVEAAWEAWRTANYTPGNPPSGDATKPDKQLVPLQTPGGIAIDVVFIYTPPTGSPPQPSWRLVTVYPKL